MTEPGLERSHSIAPGLATIIVAFNNATTIGQLVRSVAEIRGCSTVVVVDNGTDGSGDVAAAAGALVVRCPDNPGFGTGQNRGVAATTEPFLLLLNPDAELVTGGVEHGLEVLRSRPDVAAVQGVITSRRTGGPERSMGPDLRWVHLVGRALELKQLLRTSGGRLLARMAGVDDQVNRVPGTTSEVETLAATALLVRRSAFEDVGGFDEQYFLYGEDLDLCRRFRLRSWKLLGLPIPWATHQDGSTSANDFERELAWWNGTMTYAARWWPRLDWALGLVAVGIMAARLTARRPSEWKRIESRLCLGPGRIRQTNNMVRRWGSAAE